MKDLLVIGFVKWMAIAAKNFADNSQTTIRSQSRQAFN